MHKLTLVTNKHTLDWELVERFIDAGADIEAQDEFGNTPLICASAHDKLGVVKYLGRKGANFKATDNCGLTPLAWASFNGHLDVVKYLISQMANPFVYNWKGETAYDCAEKNNYTNVANCLISYMASPLYIFNRLLKAKARTKYYDLEE